MTRRQRAMSLATATLRCCCATFLGVRDQLGWAFDGAGRGTALLVGRCHPSTPAKASRRSFASRCRLGM